MKECFQDTVFTPYWWEAAPRPEPAAEALPASADVVIVGTGYTGVSAALTLARAGRRVLALDAGDIGFGASTRNGGQIGPGNQKFRIAELVERFGRDRARRLYEAGRDMLAWFKELVRAEAIDCDLRECGRFRGAVTTRHYDAMARELEAAHRFAGVEGFVVAGPDVPGEIRSGEYVGGVVLSEDGGIHPGRFHAGLLDGARTAGAVFAGRTRVLGWTGERNAFTVTTSRGRIRAHDIVIATNGYTDTALPDFARRIVPVGSGIIATEPLDPARVAGLMPSGRVYGETRRVFGYYRPSPDGTRVLFGGHCFRAHHEQPSTYAGVHKAMLRVFPGLAGVRISHAWSGWIGVSRDHFPHAGVERGVHYAMGYSGTGVTRSTWLGNRVALRVLGDPAGATAFDDLPFRAHGAPARAPAVVNTYVRWLAARDRLDRCGKGTGAS